MRSVVGRSEGPAGGKAVTEVKFFLFRGTVKDLPAKLAAERARHGSQTNR